MSGKHHYLPQFYLNGFVGDKEKLYYYRKQYNSFKEVYPAGIYYIEGLNDIDLGTKGYFDLEHDFFKEKDNRYGQAFRIMREVYQYDINDMPLQIKADIIEFVLGLWWRVPGGLQHVVDLFKSEGILGVYVDPENNVYSNKDVPDIIELMHNDIRYQKVLMPTVYEENINMYNWSELNDKFYIFETFEPLIIGDIPYVPLKTENRRGRILEEFMIPLDRNHILIYAKKHPSFLEANLLYFFNLCIVYGASEKIACSNRLYLKDKLIQFEAVIARLQSMGIVDIKERLLAPFIEFQSTFDSFESFKSYYHETDFSKYVTTEILDRIRNKYS